VRQRSLGEGAPRETRERACARRTNGDPGDADPAAAYRRLRYRGPAIAFDLDQTAYDSLYLAAALAERAHLVTADATFAAAASRHGVYASAVTQLGS
jgi:hypothetical protein